MSIDRFLIPNQYAEVLVSVSPNPLQDGILGFDFAVGSGVQISSRPPISIHGLLVTQLGTQDFCVCLADAKRTVEKASKELEKLFRESPAK
jgi:hypothetical protein